MSNKKNTAGKIALFTALVSGAYIYTIMPRVIRKPDKSAFQTRFFAHRGLHKNGTPLPENSLPAIKKAVEEGYGEDLITGLKKLSRENFADLAPAKALVILEYSHPPLSERITAIEKELKK